jgi:hypothetical protein
MPGELKEIFTAESIERMAADLEESGRTHGDPGLTYLAQRLRKLKEQI